MLLQYVFNVIDFFEYFESFIFLLLDVVFVFGVDVLFDIVFICFCLNVIKGDIVLVIEGGCCSVVDVKGEIKVSIGCGGCVVLCYSSYF